MGSSGGAGFGREVSPTFHPRPFSRLYRDVIHRLVSLHFVLNILLRNRVIGRQVRRGFDELVVASLVKLCKNGNARGIFCYYRD